MFITGHLSDISISRVDTKASNSILTRFYCFNLTLIITINFITFGTFKEIMLYKSYYMTHITSSISNVRSENRNVLIVLTLSINAMKLYRYG